jgi:hypothetical protein
LVPHVLIDWPQSTPGFLGLAMSDEVAVYR